MNLLAEVQDKKRSKQINKVICDECSWTYLAKADENEAYAIARGRVHKQQNPNHHVHLLQDIVDLYLMEITNRGG